MCNPPLDTRKILQSYALPIVGLRYRDARPFVALKSEAATLNCLKLFIALVRTQYEFSLEAGTLLAALLC